MAEFSIHSIGKEDILLSDKIPDALSSRIIPSLSPVSLKSDFGDMLFQGYQGNGFAIWYSNYNIKRPITLIGTADIPVLELQMPFQDNFDSVWDGFGNTSLKENQFEMSYTPFVNNKANFRAQHYHNLDIHWTPTFLQPFAQDFPLLDKFLSCVENRKPAHLLGLDQFLSGRMITLVKEIILNRYTGVIAERFYESIATILLIQLLERLSGLHIIKLPTPSDIEIAQEAKRIILSDLEINDTIPALARKIGTNVYRLKIVFKQVHGMSIFRYSQEIRIDFAKKLLLETDHIIQTIAEMVGYTEGNNFSDTFKKIVGVTPGYFRKQKR